MQDVLLALPLGLLIGLSLGALGAGGSILTVPALVLLLGQGPHEAAAMSLIVVGGAATTGALAHRRRGSVRLRSGLLFAAAGIAGSLVGSIVSLRTDPGTLELAFAAVMLVASAMMWRSQRDASATTVDGTPADDTPPHALLRMLLAGTLVGAMTGFFGIGGGFLAVPALVYALGLPMTAAVGTSLVVIAVNSAVALVPRLTGDLIDPWITVAFVAGGIAGALLGTRIAHHLDPRRLKRTFAIVVLMMAFVLAAHALLA